MNDQHALFPHIMAIIDDIVAYCDRVEAERQQRRGNNGGGQSILGK